MELQDPVLLHPDVPQPDSRLGQQRKPRGGRDRAGGERLDQGTPSRGRWGLYLVDALKGVFRWGGPRGRAGLQVRRGREVEEVYRAVEGQGIGIELGCGWRPWGYAWKRLGGDLRRLKGGLAPHWDALDGSLDYGCADWNGEEVMWIFASIGQDLWLNARKTFCEAVDRCAPATLIVDLPSSGPKDGVMMELRSRGYHPAGWKIRCTDYGDTVAKVKWIVVGMLGRGDAISWHAPAVTATDPNGIDKRVRSCTHKGAWLDDAWEVCLSKRISTSGEKMLPWPAGHCWPGGDRGRKRLIYDVRGPALTPKKDEVMAVYDPKAKEANRGVRWLSVDEEWLINGGQHDASALVRRAGGKDEDLKEEVLKKMPQRTAHCIMGWAERMRQEGERTKVGVCIDRDRLEADRVVAHWLSLEKEKAWLDAMAAEAIMAKLSEGSKIGYEIGWRQWCLWRRVEGKDVYLVGEHRQARKEDEDELLRYLTYLAKVMNRAEGTIRQRLFAIKMGHVVAGYEDPTLHRTRLWAALSGFKRWQPETKRKYPVLPVMMKWPHGHIEECSELSVKDKAVLWAALCTAFFYLLRASEYLVQNNREWSLKRVLKGKDIEGRKNNMRCANLSEAEEIVIYLNGSKTDQFNQGAVRNHYRSGDEKLCPVEALARLQRAFPERFQGAECEEPLFRYQSGIPVTRDEVQRLLQLAAIADGQPAGRYGSHSLRIGGATAIYMTSQDLEHVKRYGRWASSAFHNYLWESHGRQKDLSKGMAKADGQLLPPRQLRAHEDERVGGGCEESTREQRFHTEENEGYLNRGCSSFGNEGSKPTDARAPDDTSQGEGCGLHTSISKHCNEIEEGDYTKQQRSMQQQQNTQHGTCKPPKTYCGQRGSKDQSLDPFRHKKCLRLVPS